MLRTRCLLFTRSVIDRSRSTAPLSLVVPAATPDQCDTLKDVQPNWSELRKQGLSDMSEKRDDSSRLTLTEEEAVVFRGLLFDSPDGGRLSGKQLENRMKVMLQKHWDEMDGSPFHSAITMAVKSPDFKSGKAKGVAVIGEVDDHVSKADV